MAAASLSLLVGFYAASRNARQTRDLGPSMGCAGCHREVFSEWLLSPHSEQDDVQGCPDCHGPSGHQEGRVTTAVETGLREALDLVLNHQVAANRLEVEAAVCNSGAGHSLPAPGAGRLLLEIEARGPDDLGLEPLSDKGPLELHLAPYATQTTTRTFSVEDRSAFFVAARIVGYGLHNQQTHPLLVAMTSRTVEVTAGKGSTKGEEP